MNGIAAPNSLHRHGLPVVAIIATAVLVLLSACSSGPSSAGSGGSSSAGGSATSRSAVAFSACMRSHGVPNFPDPSSGGGVPKANAQELGVSSSVLQAAQTACRDLLPNTGNHNTLTEAQKLMWEFARCMRSHGVSNWPDPTIDPDGRPNFYLHGEIDPDAPRVSTKIDACQRSYPALGQGGGIIP